MKLVFALIFIQLLIVSWIDFKQKKIFNYWSVINLILSIGLHIFMTELYPLNWEILIFPIGWLVVGFLLFMLKIMGAGDSKYLASLFLVIPLEYHMVFFGKLVSSTIVVGMILILAKVLKDVKKIKSYAVTAYWGGIREMIKSRFSYAPVILLAWILLGVSIWS
jgi:prepilin peptidase CpaA